MNIQHPTLNVQHPIEEPSSDARRRHWHWVFDVEWRIFSPRLEHVMNFYGAFRLRHLSLRAVEMWTPSPPYWLSIFQDERFPPGITPQALAKQEPGTRPNGLPAHIEHPS
jgi:hypothetical protein